MILGVDMNDWIAMGGLWAFLAVMATFSVISVPFLVFFIVFDLSLKIAFDNFDRRVKDE